VKRTKRVFGGLKLGLQNVNVVRSLNLAGAGLRVRGLT
jgi:hypothetical protein